jgi:hypothetical protein
LEFEAEASRLICKKIRDVPKKTSQEIFGGYIYLELSKKILFHQTRSLNAYSQRILQSGA